MQLASTQEYIDGQFTGNLGEVLIRYVASELHLLHILLQHQDDSSHILYEKIGSAFLGRVLVVLRHASL